MTRYLTVGNQQVHRMEERFDIARSRSWMHSPDVRWFLSKALEYLDSRLPGEACEPGSHECVAHFLMGKARLHDLPVALWQHAGRITPGMKAELYDLLRTHRYGCLGISESLEKTREKLLFLFTRSLDQLKWGAGQAAYEETSPKDLALLIDEGLLSEEDMGDLVNRLFIVSGCKPSDPSMRPLKNVLLKSLREGQFTRGFYEHIVCSRAVVEASLFLEMGEFDRALLNGLEACIPSRALNGPPCPGDAGFPIEVLLRKTFGSGSARQFSALSNLPHLRQLLLNFIRAGGLRSETLFLFKDIMLGRSLLWYADYHGNELRRAGDRYGRETMEYAYRLDEAGIVSTNKSGKRTDPDLKQAVLELMLTKKNWGDGAAHWLAEFALNYWKQLEDADKPVLTQMIAKLLADRKIRQPEILARLADAFSVGTLPVAETGHAAWRFLSLCNETDRPFIDLLCRNITYFNRIEQPAALSRTIYECGLVLPPSEKQLDDNVKNELAAVFAQHFFGRAKKIAVDEAAEALRSKSFHVEVCSVIRSEAADLLRQAEVGVAALDDLVAAAAGTQAAHVRLKAIENILRQHYADQLDRDEMAALCSVVAMIDYHGLTEKWFVGRFPVWRGNYRAFDIFWSFRNWESRRAAHLEAAARQIAQKLEKYDAVMLKASHPQVFASYVLATLPYRSAGNLRAITATGLVDERLRRVLDAVCARGDLVADEDSPSLALFAGYLPGSGLDREPRFLRVTELSMLHPESVSRSNKDRFSVGPSGMENPLGADDVWELALPKYLWQPMSLHFGSAGSVVGERLEKMFASIAAAGNEKTWSAPERRLIKSAIASALSPHIDFIASPDDKKALRASLGDADAEYRINRLLVEIAADSETGVPVFESLVSKRRPPLADLVDGHVESLRRETRCNPGLAYYCLGAVLTRLSGVHGLGYHRGDENQAIVSLRMLGAYGLSQARKSLDKTVLSADARAGLDAVILDLVLRNECAGLCASKLYGSSYDARLYYLWRAAAVLLNTEVLRASHQTEPPALPVFGGDANIGSLGAGTLADGLRKFRDVDFPPANASAGTLTRLAEKLETQPWPHNPDKETWLQLLELAHAGTYRGMIVDAEDYRRRFTSRLLGALEAGAQEYEVRLLA